MIFQSYENDSWILVRGMRTAGSVFGHGFPDLGVAVNRFRYVGDRLGVAAALLYGINRWFLKPAGVSGFMHDHFNDMLLIPAALPVVLAVHRGLGWRRHDHMPTAWEVIVHLVVWSLVCERIGPAVFHRGVADPFDVVAYAVGGLGAWVWWNRGVCAQAGARLRGL